MGRPSDISQPIIEALYTEALVLADEARQALGSASTGQQPQIYFRQPELRVRARDAEMAGERELAAAAQREAVHRGDGGDGEGLQPLEGALPGLGEVIDKLVKATFDATTSGTYEAEVRRASLAELLPDTFRLERRD